MEFGTLKTVPLREYWPGEASNFTPWLAGNLQLLSEKLEMDLALESTESPAGLFSVFKEVFPKYISEALDSIKNEGILMNL